MNPHKLIKDWHTTLHERVDNLCAIHNSPDVRLVMSVILAADSTVMGMYKMLISATRDLDPDAPLRTFVNDNLNEIVQDTLSSIVDKTAALANVPDTEALVDDLLRVLETKYHLEAQINQHMEDDDEDE